MNTVLLQILPKILISRKFGKGMNFYGGFCTWTQPLIWLYTGFPTITAWIMKPIAPVNPFPHSTPYGRFQSRTQLGIHWIGLESLEGDRLHRLKIIKVDLQPVKKAEIVA